MNERVLNGRTTHGPQPEGSPALQPAADAVLDSTAPQEVLAAHAERLVVTGTSRRGDPVVVKVDTSMERHQREAFVLDALQAAGVPVPEVLDAQRHDDETAACVLVLERVDGRPLETDDRDGLWCSVGEVLGAIHDALPTPTGPPFGGHTDGTFADHLRAWIEVDRRAGVEDGWMTPAQAARLVALAGEAAALGAGWPVVLLHGDCAPHHWLLGATGSQPRPVDLGDAGVGDPAFDLMVLTLTVPHRLDAVLTGYGADADLRDHVDEVLPGYRALRLAGQVSWLRQHDYDPWPSLAGLHDALA